MEINIQEQTAKNYVVGKSTSVFCNLPDGSKIFCDQSYINLNKSYHTSIVKGYIRVGCQSISLTEIPQIIQTLKGTNTSEMVDGYFKKGKQISGTFIEKSPSFYIFKSKDNSFRAHKIHSVQIKKIPSTNSKIHVSGDTVRYVSKLYNTPLLGTPSQIVEKIELILQLHNLIFPSNETK